MLKKAQRMNLLSTIALFGMVIPVFSGSNIEGCANDNTFRFLQTTKNLLGETIRKVRGCKWVNKKINRITTYCAYGHVEAACPKTCGDIFTCECKDDPDFRFELGKTKETVDCSWITANKKKTHLRRLKYCYPGSPFYNEGKVGKSCQESCGFCSATYAPYVEKSPTPAPTPVPTGISDDSPTSFPSDSPSMVPSDEPSMLPSSLPSDQPSGDLTEEVENNECQYKDNAEFEWFREKSISRYSCSKLIESEDLEETKLRRAENCIIHEVMANCPHACALCCSDNREFKFTTPNGRERACAYITNNKDVIEKRRKKYCKIDLMIENCSVKCHIKEKENHKIKTPTCVNARGRG